ncbi:MAG: DUF2911 domain-containing protein [bacterium]|nr:DUF2911 domain-containing protein [bacterium]
MYRILVSRIVLSLVVLTASATVFAQSLTTPPGGGNQRSVVTQYMGMVSVTVDYNSPDVTSPTGEDRTGKIWGQLVPFGITPNPFYPAFGTAQEMPWRVGSNQNTKITFSHDVEIEGQALAAGTYGLFMVAGEEDWTVIFNRNSSAWGSFFWDPELDALQVKVKSEKTEAFKEWLTFEFEDRQLDSTVAVMRWEHLRVPFKISVPGLNELYYETMKVELTGVPGFQFQSLIAASQWAVQHEAYQEDALAWADKAITANANFRTISNKAGVLQAIGKTDEAMTTLEQAIEHPTANALLIHMAARGLQQQEQMENANKVFRLNHEKNPGVWPVDFGMARVYSQEGDFKKALKHAEIARGRAPAGAQLQNLETQIARLEKGENINP